MSVANEVISRLGQAKAQAEAAQKRAFQGLQELDKVKSALDAAIAGTSGHRALAGAVAAKHAAIKALIVAIGTYVTELGVAIATVQNAGSGTAGPAAASRPAGPA